MNIEMEKQESITTFIMDLLKKITNQLPEPKK